MPTKKKGRGGPSTEPTTLISQGIISAREIFPAETDPSRFAGVFPPENSPNKGPQSIHRHPLCDEIDATDEQFALIGMIIRDEAPPKNHEYTIDSDEEDDTPSSSSTGGTLKKKNRLGATPERMHSAQNQKARNRAKYGRFDDLSTTLLNTVAEDEEFGPDEKTTTFDKSLAKVSTDSPKTMSDKAKGKQKLPYPDDLHTTIPLKFVTAVPRLNSMEYARFYYVEKKRYDEEGEECPLPRPELYFAHTENCDKFLLIPKIPAIINRDCIATNPDGGPRYIHTELPALRPKAAKESKLRKTISNADLAMGRIRGLATDGKNKLLGRRKAQSQEKPVECPMPVLPPINVGGCRLSVGSMYAIDRD